MTPDPTAEAREISRKCMHVDPEDGGGPMANAACIDCIAAALAARDEKQAAETESADKEERGLLELVGVLTERLEEALAALAARDAEAPSVQWITERLADYKACRSHREIAAIQSMFGQWLKEGPRG